LIDKLYTYPKYAVSYRIPQFVGFIDEIKVRGALGSSGTEPLYGIRYSPLNNTIGGGLPGVTTDTIVGDPNIKPESEVEIETGFDATLFHSRAQLSFTVYQKRVSNLLLQASVSASRGYDVQWLNGGQFTNHGVEIQLTATPVQLRNGFAWVSTTSFTRNYSVMDALPSQVAPFNAIYPGRSVSELANSNFTTSNGYPVQYGDQQPSFIVSGTEELNFKGLHLSTTLDWYRGGTVRNFTSSYFEFGSLWGDSAAAANYVSEAIAGLEPAAMAATFVKMRSASVSYTLPATWVNTIGFGRIASARLSLLGRNLFYWYGKGFNGLDPEVASVGAGNLSRGVDITPYPPSRSFFLSLDLGL